jgi:superoxide dismutase, Fe-Mn family
VGLQTGRKPSHPVQDIIVNRWSPRKMTGKALDHEILLSVFEAARWAPSCFNEQPWRFIYAHRDTPEWNDLFGLLIEGNQTWAKDAAALVVILSTTTFARNDKPNETHSFDTGAAWAKLASEASSRGLVAHGIAGFFHDRARTELNIPEEISIEAIVAIGHFDRQASIEANEKPSDRKPVGSYYIKENLEKNNMAHTLPELPFEMNHLAPFISERTMQVHYGKHHQGYFNKLNALLEGNTELLNMSTEELLQNLAKVPADIRQKVINLAGGVWNHSFFWPCLKKGGAGPTEMLTAEINKRWGSMDSFKEEFHKNASTLFGSGWTWLVLKDGKLEIANTFNQVSPISNNMKPLLVLDVWEHAYYLDYQNKRPDFIKGFFEHINWEQVTKNWLKAKTE